MVGPPPVPGNYRETLGAAVTCETRRGLRGPLRRTDEKPAAGQR